MTRAHAHGHDDGARPHGRRAPTPATERAWPSRVLELQGLAGNRAVAGLVGRVQRQDGADPADAGAGPATTTDVPAADPLDAEQVADAIRFHRAQPWHYTPEIVSQIRVAVGLDPGDTVDEEMVQAIARWQRDHGDNDPVLTVDGKAGPRTLPRLFPHGLNAPGEGEAFGEAAQEEVIDRWGELDPAERAAELVRLVNERLTAAGVPAVTPNATDTGVAAGQFDFTTWQMDIGLAALSDEQLTRAEAADIVDTIYHEARHAEQWFRMAQMRAGRGRSGAGIATEMSIPRRIADAAVADPLEAGSMQALIAQGWFQSVYGSDRAHRERVLTELNAAAEARNDARDAFADDPTPANQAALDAAEARFDEAFADYQALPEENDAWATGPMAGEAITRGSPEDETTEGGGGESPDTGSGAEPAPEPAAPQAPTVDPASAGDAVPTGGPTELGGLAEELAGILGTARTDAAASSDTAPAEPVAGS